VETSQYTLVVPCDYANQPLYVQAWVHARAGSNFIEGEWMGIRVGINGTAPSGHKGFRSEVVTSTGGTIDSDEFSVANMWMGQATADGSGNLTVNVIGQVQTTPHTPEAYEISVAVWRR
jgi:hypothetical protein